MRKDDARGRKAALSMALLFVLAAAPGIMTTGEPDTRADASAEAPATLTVSASGYGDYTKIQNAIDAAEPGDTVYVMEGWYVEELEIYKDLTLRGASSGNTTISPEGYEYYTINVEDATVTISDLTIGAGVEYSRGVWMRDSYGSRITKCDFSHVEYAVDVVLSDDIVVVDNRFEGYAGVEFRSSRNITMSHNTMGTRTWASISRCENATLHNNTMFGYGIDFSADAPHQLNHDVADNNTVRGAPIIYIYNQTGGNVTQEAGEVILADCREVTVANQTSDHCRAILLLYSDDCTVTGCDVGINLEWSNGCWIYNNTSPSSGSGIGSGQGLNLRDSSHNFISDNLWQGTGFEGISLRDSHYNVLKDNSVSYYEYGVEMYDCHDTRIEGNVISDCTYTGLEIHNADRTVIEDNEFNNNGEGLKYSNGEEASILDNSFIGNLEEGMNLDRLEKATVNENFCDSNSASGMSIYAANSTIYHNNCTGNWESGIELFSINNRLFSNHCQNNRGDGIMVWGDKNAINNNFCTDNRGIGLYVYGINNNISSNSLHENGIWDLDVEREGNIIQDNWFEENNTHRWGRTDDWFDADGGNGSGSSSSSGHDEVLIFAICMSMFIVFLILLVVVIKALTRKHITKKGAELEEEYKRKDIGRRKGPGKALDPRLYGK